MIACEDDFTFQIQILTVDKNERENFKVYAVMTTAWLTFY